MQCHLEDPAPLLSVQEAAMASSDPTMSRIARSPEETMAIASELAALVVPGETVLLSGPLGAGKTQFVRVFCAGLGLAELYLVDSPTYTIANHYDAGPGVDHLDLYRLSGDDGLEELGFEDMLASSTIKLIEWPERLTQGVLPQGWLVRFVVSGEEQRLITVSRLGRS
jgi:tRNA threonylcarbamoyladenosine biosynthesis protein TsaE